MDKRRTAIPVLAAAAIGGYFLWRHYRDGEQDANLLRLSGNVELTEVDLSFETAGHLVSLPVEEGQEVQAGQLVAQLDLRQAKEQVNRETASVRMAESSLTQLRTGIEYQRSALGDEINTRRADVAQAEARLAELQRGSRPQEKEQARAVLAEAKAQAELAEGDWQRAQRLYKNDDISTAQHAQFRTRRDTAVAAMQRAAENLALVEEGPRKEQIAQAQAQLERARAALALSEAGHIDLKRREQEIPLRAADIDRSQAQQGVAAIQLDNRTLKAPVTGVVMVKSVEAGQVVAAGATVVTVGDVDKPWVRAYVSERDLGKVRLGMPATVTTDSFPGKQYKGKLTFIASEAEFTPKQIQTQEERVKLVYRVKVEVENPRRELKSNMPADVEIRLQ